MFIHYINICRVQYICLEYNIFQKLLMYKIHVSFISFINLYYSICNLDEWWEDEDEDIYRNVPGQEGVDDFSDLSDSNEVENVAPVHAGKSRDVTLFVKTPHSTTAQISILLEILKKYVTCFLQGT